MILLASLVTSPLSRSQAKDYPSTMKALILLSLILLSCAHKNERILSGAEKERLGLTAMIFDAPLCPTTLDKKSGTPRVQGPCELVTCQQEGDALVCKAVKAKESRH